LVIIVSDFELLDSEELRPVERFVVDRADGFEFAALVDLLIGEWVGQHLSPFSGSGTEFSHWLPDDVYASH